MAARKRLRYLNPDCSLTLREGIRELRRAEGADNDAAANVAPELAHDLNVHDAIHVLFGCPTSLAGEVIAHVWTGFGTTARPSDLHRVTSHEDHRQVLSRIGHGRLLRMWLRSLPRIVATLFNAGRMSRRWPVEELEAFLDRPLDEIRREYGIRIGSRSKPPGDAPRQAGAALRSLRA